MYTPQTGIKEWKDAIRTAAHAHIPDEPIELPVRVDAVFLMPRPKCHFNSKGALKASAPTPHTVKPDRDNLDKAVLDVLTEVGILKDDCQVYDGTITKQYGPYSNADVGTVGVSIRISFEELPDHRLQDKAINDQMKGTM